MQQLRESDLIYDWNTAEEGDLRPARGKVELDDETLRDGLQSPSVCSPSMEDKLAILHLIADLGIESADIGLPGAGPHAVAQVERLAREIAEQSLPIFPNCAARTVAAGSSRVQEVSDWDTVPSGAATRTVTPVPAKSQALRTICASQRSHEGYEGTDVSYRLLLRDPERMDQLLMELRGLQGVSRVTGLKAEEESEV